MSDAKTPTVAHALGEITWLLSQTPVYKNLTIADLEWLVMPAVLLNQFRIFHQGTQAIGFAIWAKLSEAEEQKLIAQLNEGKSAKLDLKMWKSGDRLWLMELVSPFANAENQLIDKLIAELGNTTFNKQRFNYFRMNPNTGSKELASMDAKEMGHA